MQAFDKKWFFLFTLLYGLMIFSVSLSLIYFNMVDFGRFEGGNNNMVCTYDLIFRKNTCHQQCPDKKTFILPTMDKCEPLLTCKDISRQTTKIKWLFRDDDREVGT